MNDCPCCSNPMLRHIRHHQVYWFCRSCWQEMPLLDEKIHFIGLLDHNNPLLFPDRYLGLVS